MVPMLSELARFTLFLFTPETEVAAIRYGGSAAGGLKAGIWVCLAIGAGLALARLLGGAA